ncbi:MAG: type II toxin-antitoxin system RelE/ParE family toxin [Hyphomicrobium sp.]|nr:type II toxin-antitoxin system RelE/ParE family toxin [Hyphomicrobium sp.]
MRKRFFDAFEQIAAGKADKLDIQKLVGRTGFRLRIGQYRALFTQDRVLLDVLDVGPRGGIYKD